MSLLAKPVVRTAIVEKCEGCKHAVTEGDTQFCGVYKDPAWKWELGTCNFNTHIKREVLKGGFINPLKLAKMRARGLA